MTWLDDPVAAALALPPLVLPLFVLVSALLEYVFPPYPGDTFMLVGFFLAGQGAMAPAIAFAAAFGGSVVGSIVAYHLGRRYGLALVRKVSPRRRQVTRGRIRNLFRRFGKRLLMVNRFLPVVRGFLLYGAGAMKLPVRPVIFYCTVSNLLFVSLLMSVGLWTAGSWSEIQESFQHSNRLIGGVVLAAIAASAVVTLWRLRRAPQS